MVDANPFYARYAAADRRIRPMDFVNHRAAP